jgi:hypothetical protein
LSSVRSAGPRIRERVGKMNLREAKEAIRIESRNAEALEQDLRKGTESFGRLLTTNQRMIRDASSRRTWMERRIHSKLSVSNLLRRS